MGGGVLDVGDVRSDLRKVKRDGVGGGSEEVGANGGAKVWRLSCTLLSKCIAERSVGDEAVSPAFMPWDSNKIFIYKTSFLIFISLIILKHNYIKKNY